MVTLLQHWHYDMFVGERYAVNAKFELQQIQFNTAPDGQVSSLQMDLQYGVKDIVFTRRAALGDGCKNVSQGVVWPELAGIIR